MAMMISKFNKLIHNKTVWLVFAIFISVAFVMVYTGGGSGSSAGRNDAASKVAGRLFGEDVTLQEFGRAYQNVYVMYTLMLGRQLNVNDEVDTILRRTAWQRIATLKKAEQMGLKASNEQVIQLIQAQPIFMNQQTAAFDKNAYNAFVTGFLQANRMSEKAFEELFAEQVLIEKASSAATQSALVTEDEIKEAFHLYSDKLTVEYAALPRSLVDAPSISEEDARAYFDSNPDQFTMPEKVLVNYVRFPVADYTNSVSVTDEQIAQIYEANKERYRKPADEDAPADAPAEYTPLEEVSASIKTAMIEQLARQEAFNAADTLVAQLANEGTSFEAEAEKAGLKVISNTPKFAVNEPVKGVDPTAPFAQAAFNLQQDPTHYYSDPVVGRDTVYVISLHKRFDEFPMTFEMAKTEATEAARIASAEKAYLEKAEAIHADIETSIKGGTTFADALSKYSVEISTLGPFDVTTPLEVEFGREIASATIKYDAGTLVDLISTPNDFIIAYVAEKELGDETTALPMMREELASGIRQDKAQRLAQAWQESLLEEAGFEDLMETPANGES
jgi:peptidyl-prolyl cis-trans isomerase D